jgi:hypothetical protein
VQTSGWAKDNSSSPQREGHKQGAFEKNIKGCGYFDRGIKEIVVTKWINLPRIDPPSRDYL